MELMNNFQGSGNLGMDPESRIIKNGGTMVNFSMNVASRNRKPPGNWIDVIAFGKTADLIHKHCQKGSFLIIEDGEITQDKWEDKNGQKQSKLKVICSRIELPPKAKGSSTEEDDIPFKKEDSEQNDKDGF